MADLINVAADGEVLSASEVSFLHSVTLTPAAAVATLAVKNGGASGTTRLTLQAAANGGSVQARFDPPVIFPAGVYADIGGAAAAATFEVSGS